MANRLKELSDLDKLYQQYGFELAPGMPKELRVYTLSRGYFHNAEIIVLEDYKDKGKIKRDLEAAGFSCRIVTFTGLVEAGEKLFAGFFDLPSYKTRLKRRYNQYVDKRSESLQSKYEYIQCKYSQDNGGFISEGKTELVTEIVKNLQEPGARLVIVEAAASFGKTCTSYEIVNQLLESETGSVPFFTELAKNRQAKIFRYVLLDEIDRNFPNLDSNLVSDEIERGRITLVIDGFDELLYRKDSSDENLRDSESMLDTIASLLKHNARVLLTTRKTALFTGDDFYRWVEAHSDVFEVIRYQIEKPTVESWLPSERIKQLVTANFPIRKLVNPVILSYLRNLSDVEYNSCCDNTDAIVSHYFKTMCERERDRQDLRLTVEEQVIVFRNLALYMLDQDFSSEERDFIALCIEENNRALLNSLRDRYSGEEMVSIEDLTAKLSVHWMLDRASVGESVGFVNDFVFGTMMGEALIEAGEENQICTPGHIDLCATAFECRSNTLRNELWNLLRTAVETVSDEQLRLTVDLSLRDRPVGEYRQATFEKLEIEESDFTTDSSFEECFFNGCSFWRVSFDKRQLSDVGFLGCVFHDCQVNNESEVNSGLGNWAQGCRSSREGFLAELIREPTAISEEKTNDLRKMVLEQFWPIGKDHFTETKMQRTLFLGATGGSKREVSEAIEDLRKAGVLILEGERARINKEMLQDILTILGRNSK